MKSLNASLSSVWGALAAFCGAAVLASTWWPGEQQSLLRSDSGIFVYMGQQMAEGHRLYLDLWDHKPPLIFWWNALGAWITPRSPFGVWAIASAHIVAATLMLWGLLSTRAGKAAATLGAILFLRALVTQLDQPNYTETYALPWQVMLAGLGWSAARGEGNAGSAAMAGAAGVLLAATRPNNAGAALFYLACLWVGSNAKRRLTGAWLGGSVSCAIMLATPLLLNSSFAEMWNAAVSFNLTYAGQQAFSSKMAAAAQGALQLSLSGLFPLALAGAWLIWRGNHTLRYLLPAWLVLEMCLAAMGGRSYEHYFVIVCVAAACVAVAGLAMVIDQRGLWVLSASFALLFALQCMSLMRERLKEPPDRETKISLKLLSLLKPSDSYFYWGTGPRNLWYTLHRPPPVPLFHTTPLLANAGQYRALAPKLIQDLLRNPPTWIIEETTEKEGLSPGPWDTDLSKRLKLQLLQRYEAVDHSGTQIFWKRLDAR